MKKSYFLYTSLVFILIQTSCTTSKDIRMFQESGEESTQFYIAPSPPEIKIKPFDNLYITIKTLDPEVNSIFNPTSTGAGQGYTSGTSQNFGDPASQYINGYRVSIDSTVTLPILGKINFVGLNLEQAQEHLKTRAEEFLKDPTVQVKFLNYKVNIAGEIKTPGLYFNYEGNLNILDAIGRANGITDFADLKNVVVKRQDGNRFYSHKVNLTDNSIYTSEVFYLQPNDLVYVPPGNLKRRTFNSDTYGRFLGTISILLLTATIILNN